MGLLKIEGINAFDSWYEKSGVRSGSRRMAIAGEETYKRFFPEKLILHLGHPRVVPQDQQLRRYLAAQHLYQWLRFTAHFEISVVNRATERIANGKTGLDIPSEARLTAYKIMVDECYHSLYSADVLEQLQRASGIEALPYDFTPFLDGLDAIADDVPQHRELVQLLQVVVFETLITSILYEIPGDESVITVVRDIVRDHAVDEGRHHAFFASFFTVLWGQLDAATRHGMALYLPRIIVRSLEPATESAHQALRAAGFGAAAASEIVADSYCRETALAGIAKASAKTVRLFHDHGVLDLPGVREQFAGAGLLPG
jgi:P-aminobenzoate N-oxygenase AurF